MRFTSKFVALFALASVALALPSRVTQLSSMPSNAARIAHDVDRDVLIAYDRAGNLLGELPASAALPKRDSAGTCATISADDIQKLPGWGAIHDYAADNWGSKWDTIDANPSEYRDRGAQVCISGDATPVTLDTDPSCQTQTQTTDGNIVGTDGTITLQATEGTISQTTVTVTQESSIAAGATISAKFSIPALAELTTEITSTITLTNTLSTANSFTSSNTQQQSIAIANKEGKTCNLTFDVQTCDATGHGQQRMVATGWVWFYYGKQRDGHYKWAVNMDEVLPDEEQRATYIGFTTLTNSNTKSTYQANCA
ncbi:hypothetical protein AURDEDRAFT_156435 [Auricularia subglabra TFB-10046 SS5]|nr:hypothetical protein AURDEDRAFT_156435 [Auricularia subglabra TFB-10046 SS5]